jgi:hypothetical protein
MQPRNRSPRTARLLVAITVALVASVAGPLSSAPPALASDPTLSPCPLPSNGFTWSELYRNRGVTLCLSDTSGHYGLMQIVDFSRGAEMHIVAEPTAGQTQTPPSGSLQYNRKKTPDWWNWIKAGSLSPTSSRLFSVMDASFMIEYNPTTALSLPLWRDSGLETKGYVLDDQSNCAYNVPKRKLLFSAVNANNPIEHANIKTFPTNYSYFNAIFGLFEDTGYKEGVAGFEPLAGCGPDSVEDRTMVGWSTNGTGWNNTKLYTVQTRQQTLATTQSLLRSAGSTFEIQLDGGCSMQTYSDYSEGTFHGIYVTPNSPICPEIGFSPRAVPNGLALYLAP